MAEAAEAGRVAAALAALLAETAGAGALAVSGGPDSMALLTLAKAAGGRTLIAATVDHGLRAEAATEAPMVAAHCEAIGVPHTILRPDAAIAGASLQAQAPAARYAVPARSAEPARPPARPPVPPRACQAQHVPRAAAPGPVARLMEVHPSGTSPTADPVVATPSYLAPQYPPGAARR